MPSTLRIAGGLAYRAAGPEDGPAVLLIHGWPESSWMWRSLVDVLGAAGLRAIAPDLAGYGDSPPQRPATWHRHVAALEEFRQAVGIEQCALVVHDWGGIIGLRWACDHPGVVTRLVISDTGFFADGQWHDMAKTLRTPDEGEALIDAMNRETFGAVISQVIPSATAADVDEYFRPFATPEGRMAQLELYRSGEFSELEAYEGKLAALGAPALMIWGENDPFAPLSAAHRFAQEIPGSEVVAIPGTGHFVVEDAPEEYARHALAFLT